MRQASAWLAEHVRACASLERLLHARYSLLRVRLFDCLTLVPEKRIMQANYCFRLLPIASLAGFAVGN